MSYDDNDELPGVRMRPDHEAPQGPGWACLSLLMLAAFLGLACCAGGLGMWMAFEVAGR